MAQNLWLPEIVNIAAVILVWSFTANMIALPTGPIVAKSPFLEVTFNCYKIEPFAPVVHIIICILSSVQLNSPIPYSNIYHS